MSSSQIIGNNAGTAVPVAVDSSGNVRVAVSGPVSANLYADDGSGTVPVAGEATGELKAQALGTTSGGVLTPLLVDSQGRVVTSGGVTGPTGPAGQSSTFYPYRTNTTPGTGDPGTGLVSWNNTSQLLSTQIQINHIDENNVDIDIFLALLSVGDTVTIQDRSNSANYQRWSVSGTPTSQPNYVQVPVSLDAGTWSAPNNHQIIVAFLNAGPAGPTGPTGATGATGPSGPTGATGTAAWPGTSSQLTSGSGTAVNVGSGLSLSAGTLTAGGYSTVWDVDWKTVTPTTFTTSPSTIVVNGVDVTAQKTNAAATLQISANGFDLSGQSSGSAYIEIDLSDLSIFFNRGGYRIWSMWDSSLASWTDGSSSSAYYTGVRESLFGSQLASTTRLSGNTRELRTQNPLVINDSTTNATSANFDTEIFELSPDGIMSVYLGASVGGAWPTFANMRRTLRYYTPGSWFRIVPGVSTANGIGFLQMQAATSVTYRLLRSKIDRMA